MAEQWSPEEWDILFTGHPPRARHRPGSASLDAMAKRLARTPVPSCGCGTTPSATFAARPRTPPPNGSSTTSTNDAGSAMAPDGYWETLPETPAKVDFHRHRV